MVTKVSAVPSTHGGLPTPATTTHTTHTASQPLSWVQRGGAPPAHHLERGILTLSPRTYLSLLHTSLSLSLILTLSVS